MTVNAAQIEDGVNPRLVLARSKTAVPVAMLQTDGVNQRSGVWTEEEETFLRENLGVLSMEEIAAALGRTATAVKIRWTRKGYHAPSKQPGDIVANKAGKMLQIKCPDLGGINNIIEAILYCNEKHAGSYCGGSCNETDVSAKATTNVAIACDADQCLAKPGMGVDEGYMIVKNEMNRVLAVCNDR